MTQPTTLRGADILVRSLCGAGVDSIFTLSGNHIMPVFDAAYGSGLNLIHVRHEAAGVHMADAIGRLTGKPGIALVTGGQGHSNAVAALTTARAADSPLILLSGHAPLAEIGRGSFQELGQAAMARPVTKASWTARSATTLADDVAEAMHIATTGRRGPVHLSLPVDVLDACVPTVTCEQQPRIQLDATNTLDAPTAARILTLLRAAERPLILAGPGLAHADEPVRVAHLGETLGVPALVMESPRGINDPSLGTFAEILARADLIVLLAKPHDFTIRFGKAPFVDARARFIVLDPEREMIARVHREQLTRVVLAARCDAIAAIDALCAAAAGSPARPTSDWCDDVAAAVAYRPASWSEIAKSGGAIHPVTLCRAIQSIVDHAPETIIIADGGEIGQWAQAAIHPKRRIINGIAGAIGSALPMAIAARTHDRSAPIIAVMGDGTFGFHMAEFDTAARHNLPFVAVVGNDSAWNAEHQIQLREYGRGRTHGCELAPGTRYDQVAIALSGHGELVTGAGEIGPALDRALASGKPACINVIIDRVAAPIIRRSM